MRDEQTSQAGAELGTGRIEADPRTTVCLDLGCGQRRTPGWIRVDFSSRVEPDVLLDLDDPVWPWADGSVDRILATHVVEHLREPINFFEQCFRILKPGGELRVTGPHYATEDFWSDPTHRRPLSVRFFHYFSAIGRARMNVEHYPIACDFEIVEAIEALDPSWQSKHADAQWWAAKTQLNVVQEVQATLRARKGVRVVLPGVSR